MTPPVESGTPPTRIPWPPILVAAAIAGGLMLDAWAPLTHFLWLAALSGGVLIALALSNDIWCALVLWRHATTILPHRSVSALVTTGPYRWSRNPIYVSHVALTLGSGLLLHSLWIIALTPVLAVALSILSIRPEERHLAGKFGAEFEAYAARTRRWL